MPSRLRRRPPTDVMTQVVRPDCEVVGRLEMHAYLGPGKIAGLVPCPSMFTPNALWSSQGTAWDTDPASSKKSRSVFASNDPLLQQWSRTKKRRHHLIAAGGLSLLPLPGLVAVCNEDSAGAQLGPFEGNAEGSTTAIFGPRHVVASIDGARTVATLRYRAGGSAGWCNFLVCSDPIGVPTSFATQTPNTVLLGMTAGDTASAISKVASRMVLDLAIAFVIDELTGHLADKLLGRLLRQLERRVPALVARVLRPLSKPLADAAAGAASGGLGLLDQAIRGELQADASDDAFADDWDEYMVSP